MKTLLFFLLFIPLLSVGQNPISDSTKAKLWTNETTFSFANIKPANKFTFCGGGNKSFSIEFSGDSLICSGDLKPDESAKIFIDYCRKYFKTKIDSLQDRVDLLQWRIGIEEMKLKVCEGSSKELIEALAKSNKQRDSNLEYMINTLKKIQK